MASNIGIITVLYKSDTVLKDFIESFNNQTHQEFEMFFIENDVENKYCEPFIREHSQFNYHFLRNTENIGIAASNNQGIDYFLGKENVDFILFLNNDIVVNDDFLEKHVSLFSKYAYIEALVPKIFYYKPEGKIWYAGGALSYLKGNGRHWGHNKRDKLVGRDIFRVSYAPTCSFMIKRNVLLKAGVRMWEQLFVYFDDYVFSKELWRKKVKLYYTPCIQLFHKVSVSTGGRKSTITRYYYTRNWTYLIRKYKNISIFYIPFWMLYNLIRGFRIENKAIIDSFKMK